MKEFERTKRKLKMSIQELLIKYSAEINSYGTTENLNKLKDFVRNIRSRLD